MYRTGQEMPLLGVCLISAEMCVDVNMLENEGFSHHYLSRCPNLMSLIQTLPGERTLLQELFE